MKKKQNKPATHIMINLRDRRFLQSIMDSANETYVDDLPEERLASILRTINIFIANALYQHRIDESNEVKKQYVKLRNAALNYISIFKINNDPRCIDEEEKPTIH